MTKVQSVSSSIISDLTIKTDFNETYVLSEFIQRRLVTIEATITSAQKVLSRMTKSINVASAKVLTAVTAVLLPSICFGANTDVTKVNFCCLIGLNRNSKYFEKAVDNRKKYEALLSLEGNIVVDKKASCQASPEARVTVINSNGSVTVKCLPFGNEKRFDPITARKIRRYEPAIQLHDHQTWFDTTSIYVTRTIENFYHRHIPISLNKSDLVKRRHPYILLNLNRNRQCFDIKQ